MRAPHKHPLGTADAVKLYLETTQTSTYLDWCKKLSVSTPQEENIIKQSVDYFAEKKVSDPEAHTYLANLDIFHCYIRKRPLIDFLDKTGRHPDQVNLNHASLLAIFSDNGFIQDCNSLLERGANPNHISRSGDSLLHDAIRHENLMFFNTLLRYGASTDKEFNGKTLFAFAHDNGKANFAEALMQYKLFPLHWSIRNQFDEKHRNISIYPVIWIGNLPLKNKHLCMCLQNMEKPILLRFFWKKEPIPTSPTAKGIHHSI